MYSITKCLLETDTLKLSIENKSGKKYYKEINKPDLNVLTLKQLFALLEKAKSNCLPPDYTINFDFENNQCVMTLCFDNQIIKLDEKQIIPEELDEKSVEINKLKQEITQLKQEFNELKNNSSFNEIILGTWGYRKFNFNQICEIEKPKIIKYNINEERVIFSENYIPIDRDHHNAFFGYIDYKKLELLPKLKSLTIDFSVFFSSGFDDKLYLPSLHEINFTDYCAYPLKVQWTRPYPNLKKISMTFATNLRNIQGNELNAINDFMSGFNYTIFFNGSSASYYGYPNPNEEYEFRLKKGLEVFKEQWPNLTNIVYNFNINIDFLVNTRYKNPLYNSYLEHLEGIRSFIKKFKSITMLNYGNIGLMTTFNISEVASDQYKGLVQIWD